jgi:DNA polymerase
MVSAPPGNTPGVSAAEYLPERRTLPALHEAVRGCRGCDLYRNATQAVFGEGASHVDVFLVGEQPGDKEDLAGRPFVGPAGQLLDHALEEAGIDRAQTYVTNAVKHFKWQARGKRRIHQKPSWSETVACRPWLEGELEVVQPRVVVCLGATAAQSLLGRDFRVTRHRGELLDSDLAEHVTATIHPSAILRRPDEKSRHAELAAFVDDLRVVARVLEATASKR